MEEINSIDEFKYAFEITKSIYNKIINIEITDNLISETSNPIEFKNCKFHKKFSIRSTRMNAFSFIECVFNDEVSFDNAIFKEKIRIQNSTFNQKVTFQNTKFEDLCDFWNSKFQKTTIFYKTDFFKTVVFSRVHFYENALFTYTLIDKIAIFRGTNFEKGLDFSTAIINGSLNLFDFFIKDFKAENKIINEEDYENKISTLGVIIEKNKRETFRIIKKQYENQNNHISSIKYSALELNSLYRDSTVGKSFFKKINSDLFILFLNKISNNYGKSWTRAVWFTLIVSLIFFYLTLTSTNNYAFGSFASYESIEKALKYFFEFITPTHKVDFLDAEGTSVASYIFDFLGRIFVAYGIYQVIQAFRKYRK